MAARKKRGVRKGTKRGLYKKREVVKEPLTIPDIADILEARNNLRNMVKDRIKTLTKILRKI